MTDTIQSLNEQLMQVEENLRLIQERKAEFVLEVDVPLQIIKGERRLQVQLAKLRERLARVTEFACPYRGLLAFREQDAPFFFGREAFTDRLTEAVKRQAPVVVVGPSGSGKSSVVFAGLVPRLRQANGGWGVIQFRPGSDPFDGLANALLPLLEPEMTETDRLIETDKLSKALRQEGLELKRVVERILHKTPEASLLLVIVDQFEESYTLCTEPTTRQAFLDCLLQAVSPTHPKDHTTSSLVLVLTLRADFMGQVLAYRPLADALDQAEKLLLGPMTREELEAAIAFPAKRQGVTFESGLVARILNDVGSEPGNLPLLEFALTQLWERQEEGYLTHSAYEAIGKVEGALTRYADEVTARLTEAEQGQARRVFAQLVRPGEGTGDTRRLAAQTELAEADWALVRRLADARLVVTDRDPSGQEVVELAHEVLIRSWGQLRGWIDADRAFRVWQERLRAAMRQWEVSDRDVGALLRGAPLNEAEQWLAERVDDLPPDERGYIQESVVLRERDRAAQKRVRVLFNVTGGLLGGVAGGLIGAIVSFVFIEAAFDEGMLGLVLGESIVGTLFGGGVSLGIGLGGAAGAQRTVFSVVGGIVAGMLLGIPLGPLFGLGLSPGGPTALFVFLGMLFGAVYGGGIALGVATGKRFRDWKRIVVWALLGGLVGGLVGMSFRSVPFSACVGIGMAVGIGILDGRFESRGRTS